jgi:hypothetical protein
MRTRVKYFMQWYALQTPCNRALLEKLIVAFYGSGVSLQYSPAPNYRYTSFLSYPSWYSSIYVSRSPKWSLQVSRPKFCNYLLSLPCVLRVVPMSLFVHLNKNWWRVQCMKLLSTQFSPSSCHIISLRSRYPLQRLVRHPQCVLLGCLETGGGSNCMNVLKFSFRSNYFFRRLLL